MPSLLEILNFGTGPINNAAWTLSNLCRGKKPLPDLESVSICQNANLNFCLLVLCWTFEIE